MKTSKLGNSSFPISYVIHLNLCTLWPTAMAHPFKPQAPPSSADNFNIMILSSFISILHLSTRLPTRHASRRFL
ncbi:hypothetical protein F4815DRAFT_375377 [Daldinia loculata]|nr:hypothetical protein F4815DRAFT_375377 [Daldinia loculata]